MQLRNTSLSSLIGYICTFIGIVLFLLYVAFQARFMIAGPSIQLTDEPSTLQTSQYITLTGNASNITMITLNGREIVTTKSGDFAENIVLENGYNIISIRANDRYGRSTVLEREFVYTPLSLLPN